MQAIPGKVGLPWLLWTAWRRMIGPSRTTPCFAIAPGAGHAAAHRLDQPDAILARARKFMAAGQSDEAYASYLELLGQCPSHTAALHELGCVAYADGYRSAARNIYGQIIQHCAECHRGRRTHCYVRGEHSVRCRALSLGAHASAPIGEKFN